jgi:hypothetical protein
LEIIIVIIINTQAQGYSGKQSAIAPLLILCILAPGFVPPSVAVLLRNFWCPQLRTAYGSCFPNLQEQARRHALQGSSGPSALRLLPVLGLWPNPILAPRVGPKPTTSPDKLHKSALVEAQEPSSCGPGSALSRRHGPQNPPNVGSTAPSKEPCEQLLLYGPTPATDRKGKTALSASLTQAVKWTEQLQHQSRLATTGVRPRAGPQKQECRHCRPS